MALCSMSVDYVDRLTWSDCTMDRIFENSEIVQFITTALDSIPERSLVVNCCKMKKIYNPANRSLQILYILV
jgi:hypothetical protein